MPKEKKFKGIPLSGGLLTNADIEEVDAQFSTDLINISLEKPGTLTVREGIGDSHTIDSNLITLYRWQDKIQEIGHEVGPCWVGIFRDPTDYSGRILKISYNTYPSQWQTLGKLNVGSIEPKITDLGGSLRILLGYTNRPVFLDKINRTFFGLGEDRLPIIEFNGVYVDNLNLPHSNILTTSVSAVGGGNLDDGFTGDIMYYYYKISPVYDGYQIGSLPEQLPHKASVAHGASNKTASISFSIEKDTWNPRITHLNFYRATSANVDSADNRTYYLIKSASTWKTDDYLSSTLDYLLNTRRIFSNGISDIGAETFDDGTALSAYNGQNGNFNYCFLVTGMRSVNDGTNLSTDTDFTEKNISATTMVWKKPISTNIFKFQHQWDPDNHVYQNIRLNVEGPIPYGQDGNWGDNYAETRGGGFQFIRRINDTVDDHLVLDAHFNYNHVPDSDDWSGIDETGTDAMDSVDVYGQAMPIPNLYYANYAWSQGTSPMWCNAIVNNRNILKWGKDPAFGAKENIMGAGQAVWHLHDTGDGNQSGYGHLPNQEDFTQTDVLAFGLNASHFDTPDYWSHLGDQEVQKYSFLAFKRSAGGDYYDSWDPIYYYQEIKDGGLQSGQWYWVTFTHAYLASSGSNGGETSGPNMGCMITKTDHDIEDYFLFQQQPGAGEILFRMGGQPFGGSNVGGFAGADPWTSSGGWNDSNGTQMGGWYYHSDADSSDANPHYFCVGVGLSSYHAMSWGNGGKVHSGTDILGAGYFAIFECLGPPSGAGYYGPNTVVVPKASLVEPGHNMSFIDEPGNSYYVQNTVELATDEICQLNDNTPESSAGLNIHATMEITDNGDTIDLNVKDLGRMDMEPHPSHETSLNVRYKHAKMISGRLYVANVFIENTDKSEQHPNWIMFSEMNKPDVIPITNYIGVSDLGNGQITNLEEMGGSLVVFSTNSVYRLHVPSNDPMSWSLMEAVETIGCSADDGIINVQGKLYFCARDNIYMMDANFTPQPISQYIQGTYLIDYTDKVKLRHDPIKNQLYAIFENKECYAINLNRILNNEYIWQRICFGDEFLNNNNLTDLVVDENLKSFVVFDDKVSKLRGASFVEENQRLLKATGWMKLAPQDSSIILRKLHVRYKSNVPIEFLVHIDGGSESDTLIQKDKPATYDADATNIKATNSEGNIIEIPSNCNGDGAILESINRVKSSLNSTTRLGIRCSSFKLIIRTKNTSDPDNKTFCEIYNIEVEYE